MCLNSFFVSKLHSDFFNSSQVFIHSFNMYNITETESETFYYFRIFLSVIVGFLAFSLNTLNIVVLMKSRCCFDEVTNLIMRYLSFTNALFGIIFCTLEIIQVATDIPLLWQWFCQAMLLLVLFTVFLNIWVLTFLNIDRYIAIKWPLRHKVWITTHRVNILAAILLVASVLDALTLVEGFFVKEIIFISENSNCDLKIYELSTFSIAHWLTVVFGCFVWIIPLFTIPCINCYLLAVVLKLTKTCCWRENLSTDTFVSTTFTLREDQASKKYNELRAVKTVFIITTTFLISWTAVSSMTLLSFLQVPVSPKLEYAVFCFLASSSWWNSIIYMTMNAAFRKAVMSLLHAH